MAIKSASGDAAEQIMALTGGRGVDTAIKAVGIPDMFELCAKVVAPDGELANVGVHGVKVDLHMEALWDRSTMITTRLVDTSSTAMRLMTVAASKSNQKS